MIQINVIKHIKENCYQLYRKTNSLNVNEQGSCRMRTYRNNASLVVFINRLTLFVSGTIQEVMICFLFFHADIKYENISVVELRVLLGNLELLSHAMKHKFRNDRKVL